MEPLTTYYSDDRTTNNANVAFELNSASDTLCNYFGNEYFQFVEDPLPFQESFQLVALTGFPGYLGAKEGDSQFLSLAGAFPDFYAPANVEVCPGGQTATIYRDAFCFVQNGENVCDSKNVVHMAKFPDPETEIVGKTYAQLVKELEEQTDDDLQFC